MGRPLLAPTLRRREYIACYLTTDEYHRVGRIAFKLDKHLSEWMREVLLREVEKVEGDV